MIVNKEENYRGFDKILDMWKVLTPEQAEYLNENYEIQKYKKNEIIYCEGETPTHVFYLVKGKVKITKGEAGKREQILRIIKPHETFAYRAMFAEENFVTKACTFEPSIICAIPKAVIKNLIDQNNRLAWYFIRALAVDLGIADTKTVNIAQKHIRGRLAETLISLQERYGQEEDGETLNIYLSREDLANLSNMTTSNAIRTLSAFVIEKIITMDGRKIKIIDEERLKRISKLG